MESGKNLDTENQDTFMLESIRKGQRWLTLLLVTFVGAVFVFFMGVGGGLSPGVPSGTAIVELGDFRMDRND